MLGIFKRKSEKSILLEKYDKLMKQAYDLSKVNRLQSDMKAVEAGKLLKRIDALEKY